MVSRLKDKINHKHLKHSNKKSEVIGEQLCLIQHLTQQKYPVDVQLKIIC